jgi:hypothetical protein
VSFRSETPRPAGKHPDGDRVVRVQLQAHPFCCGLEGLPIGGDGHRFECQRLAARREAIAAFHAAFVHHFEFIPGSRRGIAAMQPECHATRGGAKAGSSVRGAWAITRTRVSFVGTRISG